MLTRNITIQENSGKYRSHSRITLDSKNRLTILRNLEQPSEVLNCFLKISQIRRKTSAPESLFNKVANLRFIKKETDAGVFL